MVLLLLAQSSMGGSTMPPPGEAPHPVTASQLIVIGVAGEPSLVKGPDIPGEDTSKWPTLSLTPISIESTIKGDSSLREVSVFGRLGVINPGTTVLLHLMPSILPGAYGSAAGYLSVLEKKSYRCGNVAILHDGALLSDYPGTTSQLPTTFYPPSIESVRVENGRPVMMPPTDAEICTGLSWENLISNVTAAAREVP